MLSHRLSLACGARRLRPSAVSHSLVNSCPPHSTTQRVVLPLSTPHMTIPLLSKPTDPSHLTAPPPPFPSSLVVDKRPEPVGVEREGELQGEYLPSAAAAAAAAAAAPNDAKEGSPLFIINPEK